jgi:hypothetical protein
MTTATRPSNGNRPTNPVAQARPGRHSSRSQVRRAVREEVRRDLGNMGGAIEVEVKIRFGSGRR